MWAGCGACCVIVSPSPRKLFCTDVRTPYDLSSFDRVGRALTPLSPLWMFRSRESRRVALYSFGRHSARRAFSRRALRHVGVRTSGSLSDERLGVRVVRVLLEPATEHIRRCWCDHC